MKCSLYLIGEALTGDAALRRYIDRHLADAGVRPDRVSVYEEAEPLFGAMPQNGAEAEQMFLFCAPALAPLVAREIATLAQEGVTMRDGQLVPTGSVSHRRDYYTIGGRGWQIHAVTARSGGELPALNPEPFPAPAACIHFFDTDETALRPALKQIAEAYRIRFALNAPVAGWTECRIEADRFGDIEGASAQLLTLFPASVAAENIALWIIESLEAAGRTVTFAESCTGGLLSYSLTKESGASNIFEGALVTYSNRLKSAWIAVESEILNTHGAVSRETVEAMSAGALEVSGADYAVAVSGIAGPTGGTAQKPVGTVYVAVRGKERVQTAHLQLHGDRNYIQEQTVLFALKMLLLSDKKTFFKNAGAIS